LLDEHSSSSVGHRKPDLVEPPRGVLHRYVGKGLRGFPQSHIIGEDACHATCAQILQPIETLLLIRPQRRGESRGRRHSRGRPPALELARIVADRRCIFPARRRQVFEVDDACHLGLRQDHCARRGKPPGIGHLSDDREELSDPLRRQCRCRPAIRSRLRRAVSRTRRRFRFASPRFRTPAAWSQ
jgi:hypothetical protein